MSFRAVIFDLDGTLLDTYKDIADSINAALAGVGRPAIPGGLVKQYIGDGVENLVARALGLQEESGALRAECAKRFREEYARRWDSKTCPFPGVLDLVQSLAQRNIPMGVLSNKPDQFTRDCVARFLPSESFQAVQGAQPGLPRKPNPTGAQRIAQALGVAPEEILYVGDTATDMKTAVAAEMYPVGATWGYRSAKELRTHGAEVLINTPQDLLPLLASP